MFAGIAIGLVVLLEAMFAGAICGASMNPIRSLALRLFGTFRTLMDLPYCTHIRGYFGSINMGICLGKKKRIREIGTLLVRKAILRFL